MKPEDVAPLVAELIRDEAANISGCTFGVWSGTITFFSEPAEVNVICEDS